MRRIYTWLKKQPYRGLIHLAAISDQQQADKDRLNSYKINVIGTRNIAHVAVKYKLKVFYISTDYIFDGLTGNYQESDKPSPANWYGFTKYAGELEIQQVLKDFCIIRTSFRPIIWPFPTAFSNIYTSADYIDIIAAEIALAIKLNTKGILHLGTRKKPMYQLAKKRNPQVKPEICQLKTLPKKRYFNLDHWLSIKYKHAKLKNL